ncbi:MAG TPA: RHS repeat-associated core domain-containing protein, partial [Pirellulales bacterium]
MNKSSGGSVNSSVSYAYDAFDRMILRDEIHAPFFTDNPRYYVYDGNQIALELDSGGGVAHRLLWGPAVDQAIADDNPNSDVFWYLNDQQNTVRDIAEFFGTNDTEVTTHNTYNSFGKLTGGGSSDAFNLTYAGHFNDTLTSLQWNLERWYDPGVGSWTTEDPIGFAGDASNVYRYVGNSPTNYTDPSGLIGAAGPGPKNYPYGPPPGWKPPPGFDPARA